jgi:hypothetical protein
MTEIELEATGGVEAWEGATLWSRLLVPLFTAALVLALGLALIGLTGDVDPPPVSPPAAAETLEPAI